MGRTLSLMVSTLSWAVLVALMLTLAAACGPGYDGQETVPPLSAKTATPTPIQEPSAEATSERRPTYTPSPTQEPPPGATPSPTQEALPAVAPSPTSVPTMPAPLQTGLSILYAETDDSKGMTTLWLADIKDLDSRRALITLEHKIGYGPSGAISPDGRRLAYVLIPPGTDERAARTSGGELWVMDVEGMDRRKLADKVGYLAMWSPDSAALIYGRMVPLERPKDPQITYRTEFYLISTKEARQSLILANDTDYGVSPVGWSSDAKLFYYAAVSLEGEWELRGVEVPSGVDRLETRLPWDLASGISLSPDGTRVMFSAYEERQPVPRYALVALPISGGEGRKIISGAKGDETISNYAAVWSPDGQKLIAHIPPEAGQRAKLERIDLGTGERHAVAAVEVTAEEFLIPRSLSPDGEWLIVLKYPSMQPYLVSTIGGRVTPILPAEPSHWVAFIGWAITGS